jgi:hypothetical protein
MSISLADFAQIYKLSEYAQKQKKLCPTLKVVLLEKHSKEKLYPEYFVGAYNSRGYYGRVEDGRGNCIAEYHLTAPSLFINNQPTTALPANHWNASMFEKYGYKVIGNPDQ